MAGRACAIVAAGSTPANDSVGVTSERGPSKVPGLSTALQPTSAASPTMAPNFRRPVSWTAAAVRTTIGCGSSRRLEQITPAPKCALLPMIESPT